MLDPDVKQYIDDKLKELVGSSDNRFASGIPYHTHNRIDGPPVDYNNLENLPTNSGMADPGSNGIVVRTSLNITTARTISAGSSKVSVSNGNGTAGNPSVDVVEANLNVQNMAGLPLPASKGGTGLSTITSAGLMLGNGTGNVQTLVGSTANDVPVWNGSAWVSSTAPTSALSFMYQRIGTSAVLTGASLLSSATSATTNASSSVPFFVASNNNAGGDRRLMRFTIDPTTGLASQSHVVTPTYSASGARPYLAAIGSYVYAVIKDTGTSAAAVYRYNAADLTAETTITTTPGTVPGFGFDYPAFTDGTFLYIGTTDGTNTMRKYTITGTTFALTSTLTYTGFASNSGPMWCDGTYAYQFAGSTIRKWAIAGGAIISTDATHDFSNQANVDTNVGGFGLSGTTLTQLTFEAQPTNLYTATYSLILNFNPINKL